MRRGKRWKPGRGQAPMADFCMSPWGQGWFCVQKWFRTSLRVWGESRGSGSPRDCSTLHLPVGVSLWKSTSELKPNKKSIKSKLIYALSFPKPVSQNASWADISPFPFMSTLVSSEAAVTHFISTINGTDRLTAKWWLLGALWIPPKRFMSVGMRSISWPWLQMGQWGSVCIHVFPHACVFAYMYWLCVYCCLLHR